MATTAIRTVNIRGKEYVDVAERVRLSHADEQAQGFSIVEKERYELRGRFFYSVTLEVNGKLYIGDAEIKFDAKPGTPDGASPLECAQTSAIGRALGFAGYGATDSIASADEVARSSGGESHVPLDGLVKRAKERALALDVAKNAEQWAALLSRLHIATIKDVADVSSINGFLTAYESVPEEAAD